MARARPGGLDVALKFIRLDAQVRALELRSLEVMKRIRHPNLVSLFGAWHKDNWLILAMELCDRSLQDRLAEALDQKLPGIPLQDLLSYMSDAANGLDALNAKQVQHRDVKPANLLLLNSGVKVADFGLAKALEQTVASNSGGGTLAYTAPECFKGQLTQQSDQYSLAVTYYHLRTGRLLFKGDQALVMYAHLETEPDLSAVPSARASCAARALSKEPDNRWPNCKAFVTELIKAHQEGKEKPKSTASLRPNFGEPREVMAAGPEEGSVAESVPVPAAYRRLPVYILIDCSLSMAGDPMESVRMGLRSLLVQLQSDPLALESVFLSVITFGSRAPDRPPHRAYKLPGARPGGGFTARC